jgi:Protein of unknown function (DUF2817)
MPCWKILPMISSDSSTHQTTLFANNYEEGRKEFLALCAAKNLSVQSHVHPDHKGPHGEDLAMDSVWIGPKDAHKVLCVTCGTHGLEAAAGAATLRQFLQSPDSDTLPTDSALLIVHAINPYGWAYDRRGNEDGIDLNRNCLDHAQPHPLNPVYDDLHAFIKTPCVDEAGQTAFIRDFYDYAKHHGLNAAVSGITAGQYNHPDGISYGGMATSWSVETLRAIIAHHLGQAQNVILVDWHTGIGRFGKPFFIMDDPTTSPAYARASSWWSPHKIHSDDILEGGSPAYTGLLIKDLKAKIKALNGAQTTSVVIEWGTYEMDVMLSALLLDNWLRGDPSAPDTQINAARTQLVERFYPKTKSWRTAVLDQAPALYRQALRGLQST